jgi:hypothetical protein
LRARERERERPITSQVDLGNTIPVLGLTQYFFGFVVFTYSKPIPFPQIKIITNTQNAKIPKNHKILKILKKEVKFESELIKYQP